MWDHPDFLQIVAAGNSGPGAGSIGCPATNKNGIAVGASENDPISFREAGYGISVWAFHVADDTCRYSHDAVCDEPQHCAALNLVPKVNCSDTCTDGTDCTDCGNCPNASAGSGGAGSGLDGEPVRVEPVRVSSMRQSDFGPRLYEYSDGIQGQVALAEPQGACSPLSNRDELEGKLALVTVSVALLEAGKACTFVTMATHVMSAGATGMLMLSYDYHLLSDDTNAAAAVSIPVFILNPTSLVWDLVLAPLFRNSSHVTACKASVTAAYTAYRYLEQSVSSCLDSLENPDASSLIAALNCLGEGIHPDLFTASADPASADPAPADGNQTVRLWLRFNMTELNETHGIDNLAYFSGRGPTNDGRIKPDLVRMGWAADGMGCGFDGAWWDGDRPD